MPLYIEIVDQNRFASDSVLSRAADASILERWTSETTGATVRLVDAVAVPGAPRTTVRGTRILFC